jgi:hypothetical protein
MIEEKPRYYSDSWNYKNYWNNLLDAEKIIQSMKEKLMNVKHFNVQTNCELEELADSLHVFLYERILNELELEDAPENDEEAREYFDRFDE